MMILAPIAAYMLQMALSRGREFEADRSGAHLLHDGEPLARALEKIEAYAKQLPMNIDPAQAPGVHHQPAHRTQVRVRQAVQLAPADRGADPAPALRALLATSTLARCSSGGRGPASSSASSSSLPHW